VDIITGVRQLIQDLVSPDLKAIKEKQEALARELELTRQSTTTQFDDLKQNTAAQLEAQRQSTTAQFEAQRQSTAAQFEAQRQSTAAQFEAQRQSTAIQFDALIKTIEAFRAEFRAEMLSLRTNNQLEVQRQIAPLAERLAALEQQR
jgi:hypothetical protein